MPGESSTGARRPIGVAVAGFGWMGRVHTQAYLRVLHHFPRLPVAPQLVAVADEAPGRAEEAAAQFGFATATRDWRELAADPRVEAVSVAAPNFLHREIGVGLAQAGKHVWIEKPVGLSTEDARAVAEAIEAAGVQGTVGFNYRNAPAVATAREMIAGGELGTADARALPPVQRLRRASGGRPDLALRARARRQRRPRGPRVPRRRPRPPPAGRHRVRGRRHARSSCAERARAGGRHGRARARGRRRARAGGERGLRRRPAALRVGRPRRPGGEPRRGRGAEQLRLRGARHARRGVLGLPPHERAGGQRGRHLRGPAREHGLRRARRTASTRPSSPARPSPWATTTSR